VAHRLAGVLGTPDEHSVLSERGRERELVESHALAASLEDAGTGASGEAEGADGQLRELGDADIVSDGADKNGDLRLLASHELGDATDRERRAVDLRHVQALEHDRVEAGVSAAGEEAVELNQERDVHVVRFRVGAVLVSAVAAAGDEVFSL